MRLVLIIIGMKICFLMKISGNMYLVQLIKIMIIA